MGPSPGHGPAVLREVELSAPAFAPGRRERLAVHIIQFGALLVMLAAVTWKTFELDRFFVPKELVLHATALLAALLAARAVRRTAFTRADTLLALFLLLGTVSAALATNPWLGARALAISASGITLFWVCRGLAIAGLGPALLRGLGLAIVTAAATALLQTYGVRTDFFSINRAPGGTLGNRNFVAHLAAFGFPLLLLLAVQARRTTVFLLGAAGAALVSGTLILTRSRAGWLAFAAAGGVLALAFLASPPLRRDARSRFRLAVLAALAVVAVTTAVFAPNTLRWRSDSPYLESVRAVANYQEGSGRGRLIQYRQSLRLALAHPLLGAGPGNWAVLYPEFAARRDPSLDRSAGGMTSNPWPSSDWVAYVSERGFAAALLLGLFFLALALEAGRRLRATALPEDALAAGALLAMLAATLVAGLFDAVLLLAPPTLVVWGALGSLRPHHAQPVPARRSRGAKLAFLGATLLALGGASRSTAQLAAMGLSTTDSRVLLRVAGFIDPASYRIRLQLARSGGTREQRCAHALAARALYPHAEAARRLARRCD